MPVLIVITGPTGSGKTALAVDVAVRLGCHVISADSRQIYRGIPITTAAPDKAQLAAAPHHFIAEKNLDEYYSAAEFENDVMTLLPALWHDSDYAVMCGGSMMYVDSVLYGIDELPTVSEQVRREAYGILEREGTAGVIARLRRLDPDYLASADLNNHKRLVHALEVSVQAGVPYSSLCTGRRKQRDFRILKVAIDRPREDLFARINARVDMMVEQGMEQEARSVSHLRHLNSLNTVGFKEMFAYFDGVMDRDTAINRIKKNTRVYAKKQLTWLKRSDDTVWLAPDAGADDVIRLISGSSVQ